MSATAMWPMNVYVCLMVFTLLYLLTAEGHDNLNKSAKQQHATVKMRHSRHSPPTSADNYIGEWQPSKSSSYSHHDEKDNHKPVFVNCSQYQPTIKEEQPTGLFVIQVLAIDKDPLERGGTITYSFVVAANDQMKFYIDSKSGVITTKHMFNRDEPAREKEVYVTVRASDNGKPQLDDICRFKVIIEDVNDNTPTFDKVEYRESIPKDMEEGREVMRVSATDIDDGNNRLIDYELIENNANNVKYFKVDRSTGIVKLDKRIIDKEPGYEFRLTATASDRSSELPNTAYVKLIITVVESDKKPPCFTSTPLSHIRLLENFTDYSANIATFTAESNTEEKALRFTLVTGNSEQTNKKDTFRLVPSGNSAYIRLGGAVRLDYEELSEYSLLVRAENKYNLGAEQKFVVQLLDVNDMFPIFSKEINSGTVLENEPLGTPVMQVSAIDGDITPLFRKITYSLEDNQDKFAIDPDTGNITTRMTFDREQQDVYNVKVIAIDGAPSALFNDGQPNSATQVFKIEIADRNDNPPHCEYPKYEAFVSENADLNAPVTEIHAKDSDSASTIRYSIQPEGNTGDDFYIESETGKIKVKNKLDYEKITEYTLKVVADDSLSQDTCTVLIEVQNIDDHPPIFLPVNNITISEDRMYNNCINTLQAYDPDIPNRSDPQNITYSILKEELRKFLQVDDSGCLKMLQPLDRDLPNGTTHWQVLIQAVDKSNANCLMDFWITLIDVNDNAPFLQMDDPVIWRENQQPGNITMLKADDYDSPANGNGNPFIFEIAPEASHDIRSKFYISGSSLNALVTFDREKQKEYKIPIAITDGGSPPQTGVSYLTVIIGDENDNPMKEGSSSIFVYSLEGHHTDIQIGRVYVDDPDDWDLPDKRFHWDTRHPRKSNFILDANTGMITMSNTDVEAQSYILHFQVQESFSTRQFESHSVGATVNVTLKRIPEEAVVKSGSIRFEGVTAEEFVTRDEKGENKADVLKSLLAAALNNSEDNIDVFTVLRPDPERNFNKTLLDVRFSAHGSPYYSPERINSVIIQNQAEFESVLGLQIKMVNVDECVHEKVNCPSSCWNHLVMTNEPAGVYTNVTSFIGVSAYIEPTCECRKRDIVCLNGGTATPDGRCECTDEFEGPHCGQTSIGFSENGWALYPTFDVCEDTHIVLYVQAAVSDGLIFYLGPESAHPSLTVVQDFIALELRHGHAVLLVDYGTGTARVEHNHKHIVGNGYHKIEIILKKESVELKVDGCQLQECLNLTPVIGNNKYLNIHGPLQLGGTYMDLSQVSLQRDWNYKPTTSSFIGCIENFTVNNHLYNLAAPSLAQNAESSCSQIHPSPIIVFGFDWPFFIAIIICLAVLTILLLAVAVHRRKVEDMYKDADDIRENIINYEDEGGGEGDTAYDLNVLRLHYDENGQDKYNMSRVVPATGVDEAPDICGFLDGKKQSVDNDPETLPFDDVRHYAYEGDGNTTGSLSSLASGTDEGDLNFDYLSNFGPRFRKLADMYGEDASDEDSDTYHNANSESWC